MPAMSGPRESGTLREPLGVALEEQVDRLQLVTIRCWQGVTLLGLFVAAVTAVTVSRPLGQWCALAALGFFTFFSAQGLALRRRRGGKALATAGTIAEGSMPWVFLLVIALVQGPAYALGSWVPPLLFAALIVVSTARLQPSVPLALGLSGGVAFPLLYFAVLREQLPAELYDQPLYQPAMQLTRGVSLVLGGAIAMLVSRELRRAIGKADRVARQRELFGKYRILGPIASGGMGVVFKALYCPEGGFERPVAIKRIHPHLAAQPRFVRAFRSEAELSVRLVHPNIVQVLDFGRIGGSYFLAMEYVDGITLAALMRRVQAAGLALAPSVVAHIGREVLAGLAYSHRGARALDGTLLRVIHRDVCPANVLLTRNGEAKISDFGVAKALRRADRSETKTLVGHAGYVSPEQARADPIDERCDLFAVAVMLWEMLCGRPLFERGADGPTLLAVIRAPIPAPSQIRGELSVRWDRLIARGLAREPDERYRSAAEMAAALTQIEDAQAVPCPQWVAATVAEACSLPDPPDRTDASDLVATRVLPR